jgi:hypothetical protein
MYAHITQHSIIGDASPVVFQDTVPKVIPAQWSFTIQCQWGCQLSGLSQCNAKRDAGPVIFYNAVSMGIQA